MEFGEKDANDTSSPLLWHEITLPWYSCDPSVFPSPRRRRFWAELDDVLTIPPAPMPASAAETELIEPIIPIYKAGKIEIIPLSELHSQCCGQLPAAPSPPTRNVAPVALSTSPQPPAHTPWGVSQLNIQKQSLWRVSRGHDYTRTLTSPARGLVNNSNMCFFNAVLQAIVHCERFASLLDEIWKRTGLSKKSSTPVLDGLVAFAGQYSMVIGGSQIRPLSAEQLYSAVLSHPNFRHLERGRQEDAQEFLSYLLDTLESDFDTAEPTHDDRTENTYGDEEDPDDGWTEIGRDSRPVKERHTGRVDDGGNPILRLFGGRFRSVLRRNGNVPSITMDPFQQVQVDISNTEVSSVQQAINLLCNEEHLMMGGTAVTKKVEFDRVPPLLIVHLKRFTFIRKGNTFESGKITKPVVVDPRLTVGNSVYEPFAVVYHHGPSATMGHYTCDVLIDGQWYNIDDDYAAPTEAPAAVPESLGAAYIVFYEVK